MQNNDLKLKLGNVKHVHLIGIGGAGMCGIAEMLAQAGYHVSGSDINENNATIRLKEQGVIVFKGHCAEQVAGADVVVYSTIIQEDNPEIKYAREQHIPIIHRAEMLAELMHFFYGIAIAGTHGKTTTTGLMTMILHHANLSPTFAVGGLLNDLGRNAQLGQGDYFVIEADESDASFLNYHPTYTIVTNIDEDHMSTYNNDFSQLKQAFINFIHHLPFYGYAFLCVDDPVIKEIIPYINRKIITYGFSDDAMVKITDFCQINLQSYFKIHFLNEAPIDIQLNLAGQHNALNATAAFSVAKIIQVSDEAIKAAFAQFKGLGRRMEIHGEITLNSGDKILVMDDYGHHPREIAATVNALKNAFPERRIIVAFQPHRYSRTYDLLNEFVEVLSEIPALILLDIYSAGEQPIENVNSHQLCELIEKRTGRRPYHAATLDDLHRNLNQWLLPNDLLLLQGAGSIGPFAAKLVQEGLKYE